MKLRFKLLLAALLLATAICATPVTKRTSAHDPAKDELGHLDDGGNCVKGATQTPPCLFIGD